MREERNVLNSDVEIPEVVLKKTDDALAQIREKRYDERLRNEGRNNILAYGVAFCKKRCKVAVQRL